MRGRWLALLMLACMDTAPAKADWPGFRGPRADGVADEKSLPLKWGPTENIAWKVTLPGPGASSPIVWGDRVFVTAFTGTKASEIVRYILCFDRDSGKKLWERKYPAPQPETDYKAQVTQHGLTTSTPITDGKRLYVFFGRGGVKALDLDGNPIWDVDIGEGTVVFGSGASPSLLGDMLLINACTESRHLLALDKATGKMLWRSEINGMCWSTPVVVEPTKGQQEIVLNVGAGLYGFDAKTGKELWCADIAPVYNSSTPLVRDNIVYVMNHGQGEREIVAVRAGGRGDVTKTHIVWKQTKAGASYTSPLLLGDRLFYFSGQAYSVRAGDGEIMTRKSLAGGLENLYGSPILAGDRILVFTRFNGAYVLSADDKLEVLAHNQLGDDSAFNASPALDKGQVFIRSNEALYCIGKK